MTLLTAAALGSCQADQDGSAAVEVVPVVEIEARDVVIVCQADQVWGSDETEVSVEVDIAGEGLVFADHALQ